MRASRTLNIMKHGYQHFGINSRLWCIKFVSIRFSTVLRLLRTTLVSDSWQMKGFSVGEEGSDRMLSIGPQKNFLVRNFTSTGRAKCLGPYQYTERNVNPSVITAHLKLQYSSIWSKNIIRILDIFSLFMCTGYD